MTPWQGTKYPPRAWQEECFPIAIRAMKEGVPGLVSAIMGSGKSILQAEIVHEALPKMGTRAGVVVAPRQNLVNQLSGTIADRCGLHQTGVFFSDRKEPWKTIIVCCAASLPALTVELRARGRKVALLIVDEAHGSEADTLRLSIPELQAAAMIGFTATPFRSIPKESLSVFKQVLYRYTMDDALRDKVLVPLRHVRYEGLKPGTPDEECLDMIQRHGQGPGIVSARTIEDAESYAEWLIQHGISAAPIHSLVSSDAQKDLLDGLKVGRFQCLVHVSLLAEGVDLPWLRWICLRRNVGASVRFFQEMGRVLRCHPGKTEGIVMDPHLLLGRFGLTTAESIGRALEDAANLEADREAKARALKEAEVVALDALVMFAAEIRDEMERAGLAGTRHEPQGTWRIADVSKKQVATLEKLRGCTRHIPAEYRAPIKALARHPWALTRGQASDVMDVLISSAAFAREKAKTSRRQAYMIHWSMSALPRLDVPIEESGIIEKMKEA